MRRGLVVMILRKNEWCCKVMDNENETWYKMNEKMGKGE